MNACVNIFVFYMESPSNQAHPQHSRSIFLEMPWDRRGTVLIKATEIDVFLENQSKFGYYGTFLYGTPSAKNRVSCGNKLYGTSMAPCVIDLGSKAYGTPMAPRYLFKQMWK